MIKGWIELHVWSEVLAIHELEQLEELGVTLKDEDKHTWKRELLQISNIGSVVLEREDSRSVGIYIQGEPIVVRETPEEIIELIKQNQL